MGKCIYKPKGKALEYAEYACNFFIGCSCECSYCFNKKGMLSKTLGGNTPTLKKCFKDEKHALEVFEKELKQNLAELQKHGLFFSFTTDPFLNKTIHLHLQAADKCLKNGVSVKFLTKRADWLEGYRTGNNYIPFPFLIKDDLKDKFAFGFTLTGHDELEPNASTNAERIEAMRKLHEAGFKTWASIEPVIDFESSLKMIYRTTDCCDLYKIGLQSGKKYDEIKLWSFIKESSAIRVNYKEALASGEEIKIYFKDSLLAQAGINREDLPANCVGRDYDIFNN